MTAAKPTLDQRWSPGPKLTPKIILEGTRLTHKTDLAFALNDHPRIVGPRRYRYHSPLISGEWGSFHPYPWSPGLVDYGPEDRELATETYATWTHMFELQRHYSWIVDRFHLATMAWQSIHRGVEEDFDWLEGRLEPIGFHIVLCTRREETFPAARADRLTVSGKPDQYDDLSVFIHEQKVLLDLAAASRLPVLQLDLSDGDTAAACDAVADWMTSTGGLWAPGTD